MTLVSVRGVSKSVALPDDSRLDILRGVDLDVEAGDHVSIVGRSGSGKTTLLNILGLLDAPTDGTVVFGDSETQRMRAGRLDRMRGRNVGFVFQQFNLLPARTALENVMMPLSYATGRAFWNRRALATSMLERVGLGHRLLSTPERLSGGEQQRVAIARALVRGPRLILADEPTGALDVETGAAVMALLDEVATESGAALVTITHDLHVAARARRHYRLDHGVLSPADLSHAFASSTLTDAASAEALGPVGASVPAADPVVAEPPASDAPATASDPTTPDAEPATGPLTRSALRRPTTEDPS